MAHSIKVTPSLLSANFGSFCDAAQQLVSAGAESLHFDLMDGHFVPNLTFGPQLVRDLRRALPDVLFDTHLMVEHPETYVDELAVGGASMMTVHCEATNHLDRLVHQIKDAGMQVGVALNPATPVGRAEWVLGEVDRILVMTVNPGFGGQSFIHSMLGKIDQLAQIRANKSFGFEIAVDGGVSPKTAPAITKSGATALIAGSAVFNHPEGMKAAMEELLLGGRSGL